MLTRIALFGGIAVGLVAGGLGVWSWQHARPVDAGRVQQVTFSATDSATTNEVKRLQERLALMEVRAAANERTVSDLANGNNAAKPSDSVLAAEPQAPPDPAAEAARVEAFAAKEAARWERSFEQESREPNWARASEGQLQQLTQTSFASVKVKDLECRSQTCRFTADVGEQPQQVQAIAYKLKESFPVVHLHRSDTPGQERYFVTKGEGPAVEDD
jgi:hypothetical protein